MGKFGLVWGIFLNWNHNYSSVQGIFQTGTRTMVMVLFSPVGFREGLNAELNPFKEFQNFCWGRL